LDTDSRGSVLSLRGYKTLIIHGQHRSLAYYSRDNEDDKNEANELKLRRLDWIICLNIVN